MNLISKYVPIGELVKYESIFSTEEKTNEIEQEFNQWLSEFDRCIYHSSGDIDLEYLIECFHEFMQREQEINNV